MNSISFSSGEKRGFHDDSQEQQIPARNEKRRVRIGWGFRPRISAVFFFGFSSIPGKIAPDSARIGRDLKRKGKQGASSAFAEVSARQKRIASEGERIPGDYGFMDGNGIPQWTKRFFPKRDGPHPGGGREEMIFPGKRVRGSGIFVPERSVRSFCAGFAQVGG